MVNIVANLSSCARFGFQGLALGTPLSAIAMRARWCGCCGAASMAEGVAC